MAAELLTYCQTAQQLGVSANAALKLWVAAGRPIRRATFYQTWRAGLDAETAFAGFTGRQQ